MNPDDDREDSQPLPAPHSLVLFIGFGLRPDRELVDTLARAGLRGLWLAAPPQGLLAAAHARFDAVVLRVSEPMASVARRFDLWRTTLRCPLLVVSESADEVDEIIALELGADGYLGGPLAPRRLRAHLQMLLRRAQAAGKADERAGDESLSTVAGWALDRGRNRLLRDDRHVDLTEMQAGLMQVFMQEQGRVVARSRLLESIARGRELHARSVDVYVARLRARLRDERVDELEIEGVRGRGYLLSVVRAADRASSPAAGLLHWLAPARPDVSAGHA